MARKIVEQWREERAKMLADFEESGRRYIAERYRDLVDAGLMPCSFQNYRKRINKAISDRKAAQNASKTKI